MNKKIVSEIAVGVILLIAIIVGGVFWLQNNKQAPAVAPVTTQPVAQTPVVQPATQPVAADETANWQTYTNTKYGFEIKIPQEWKVKNEEKVPYDIESTDKIAQTSITFSVQNKGETFDTLNIIITPTKSLKLCENTPFCNPGGYIKQNSEFIFGFLSGDASGPDPDYYNKYMKDKLQDNGAVIESFKFTK